MRVFFATNPHDIYLHINLMPPLPTNFTGTRMDDIMKMRPEDIFGCLRAVSTGMLLRSLCVRPSKLTNQSVFSLGVMKRSTFIINAMESAYYTDNMLVMSAMLRMQMDGLARHGIYKWVKDPEGVFDDYYARNKSFSSIIRGGDPLRDSRMIREYAKVEGLDKDLKRIYDYTSGSIHASCKDFEFPLSFFMEEGFETDVPLLSLDYDHMFPTTKPSILAVFVILTNKMISDTSFIIGESKFWPTGFNQDYTYDCGIRLTPEEVQGFKDDELLPDYAEAYTASSEDWLNRYNP